MKNNITERVFILDRSGSMVGLEKYGWEFLFIGAKIDSVETASRYGIRLST